MVNLDVETVKQGTVKTPATGLIVEESHYVTTEDKILLKYPSRTNQFIEEHLLESKSFLLKKYGVAPEYKQSWQRVWTPSESGPIGANAREEKTSLDCELFQANMYFKRASFPPRNEKWLITNPANGKSVVVCQGWELGPSGLNFIAGASVETHFFLDSNNDTKLTIGKLKNQELNYGPITNCK